MPPTIPNQPPMAVLISPVQINADAVLPIKIDTVTPAGLQSGVSSVGGGGQWPTSYPAAVTMSAGATGYPFGEQADLVRFNDPQQEPICRDSIQSRRASSLAE